MNASRSFVVNKLTQTLFCCMRQLHLLVRFIICCSTQTVRRQMNDIEFCLSSQINVLLHDIVLASFAGKMPSGIICCLLQMVRMQMNESSFVVSKPTRTMFCCLFVAYCRWSVRTTSRSIKFSQTHRTRFCCMTPETGQDRTLSLGF